MAEVTRAAAGIHSLSSKKPPSFSSNSFTISSSSSSSKHIYDDVFASTPPNKLKSSQFSSVGDDDYGEIFGSSKSENGVWQSSTSSIPILNLPDSERKGGGSKGRVEGGNGGGDVDYLGVFGDVGDDSFAFPSGEEVFNQLKKKAKTSASASMPRSKGQTREATRLHIARQSENGQRPTREFSQSFDSVKHFQRHVETVPNEPNGATHVAHIHAIPASTSPSHEVGPSQKEQTSRTPMIKEDTEVEMGSHPAEEGKHCGNTSSKLGAHEQKVEHDAGFQKPSYLSESISMATSYENHEANTVAGPSKVLKGEAKVQFDVKDDLSAAIPGSTSLHEVDPSQKIQTNRAEHGIDISQANKMVEASRKTSFELEKGEESRKTSSELEKGEVSEKTRSELEKGEVSGKTSSELGGNEERANHDIGSQKACGLRESNSVSASHDTCQASIIVGTSTVVKDDTEVDFDVKYTNTDARPSDFIPNKQNGENDAVFQKASGSSNGLIQNDISHDSCPTNYAVGSSKAVKEDSHAAVCFDVGKKQGRHARMNSLDLRDHKHACQSDAGSQRKSRFGSSHSFDASHDPFVARIKVQPSKVVPSSSLPQFFPIENHCKISENSSYKNSEKNLYKGAGGYPPSLDEQLDVNSLAAISAAALQKAIEEAEMRIRLAKEFLEREGHGNMKLSFKDTLKRKVGKENSNANERSEYQHTNVQHRPQIESTVQNHSYIDRKSALQTAQVAPLFEGQKKFLKDEEPMERINANVLSNLTEEGDKREGGGEWEAAKHLNQLISGVKNRIASFMTWQAETENKEEPKESEASRKSQSEQKLKHAEVFEMKETEINQYDSVFAYETKDGGSETELIPKVIEPDENELIQSPTVMQEKAGHIVDVVPHNEGPTRTNFLYFSFSSERSWGYAHPEGGEKEKPEDRGELGVENRQKEEIDEVKDDQLQNKTDDINQEGLESDNHYTSQDSGKSLQSSCNSDGDGIVEELYSDRSKFNCEEEDSEKSLNEDRGDDKSELTHADNHENTLSEECEEDRSELTCQGNKKPSEEFGEYKGECTYQEKEMPNDECEGNKSECNYEEEGSLNEECGDDKNKFTHQENGRLSEECGDNSNESGHEEDIMLSEEHRVDQSYTTHAENNDKMLSKSGSDQSDCTHERTNNGRLYMDCREESINSDSCPETIIMEIETDSGREEYGEVEEAEDQLDNREVLDEVDLVGEIGMRTEAVEVVFGRRKNECDQDPIDDTEKVAQQMDGWEENKKDQSQSTHAEETENKLTDQVDCILAEDECKQTENKASDQVDCVSAGDESYQTENEFLSKVEETCDMHGSNLEVEETVISDEEIEIMMETKKSSSEPEMDSEVAVSPDYESEKMMETTHPSSEPKKDAEIPAFAQVASEFIGEERVLLSSATKDTMEFPGIVHLDGTDAEVLCENFVSHKSETEFNCGQKDIGVESKSEEIWEYQTEYLNESALNLGKAPNVSDHVQEKSSFEAVHRRRRWFENSEKVGNADRPSILEVEGTNLEIDEEVLEESDLPGSVKIHGDKLEAEASEVTTGTGNGSALNQEENGVTVEATPKRRRWFASRGGEGILEPQSLFAGIKVTSEMDPEIVNESEPNILAHEFGDHMHTGTTVNVAEGDVVVNEDKTKQNVEATPRRKRWFESEDKVGSYQQQRKDEDAEISTDINQEHEEIGSSEKFVDGKDDINNKTEPVFEVHRDLNAVNRKKKEKEKERIAVERAIREARERAFAEARERARRDAVERPILEGNQKVGSGVHDRPAKASSEATSASDKASMEAKHRAERAAVERATAEARERALQKALSEKASHKLREPTGRHQPERNTSFDPKYQSSSSYTRCSDPSNKCEKIDGGDGESEQRCKARLERQKRTMERTAKALEEKNTRDLQAQKEQAAKNMFADTLDAEVKRWSSGKEGNLRALLSTLQYILGSESGWQAISLTDLVAPTAVRKAYKKATLCVHPDKLQQRGATIQQKYICEKVFDLLKEAWSKFNPDDR